MRYRTLFIPVLVLLMMSQLATSLPIRALTTNQDEYVDVDLAYLITNKRDFLGVKVRTIGTVRFGFSFYMFEDFWLEALSDNLLIGYLPVVVRFAGLTSPPDGSLVVVVGVIEYSDLEGGFFYLNAPQWTYARLMGRSGDLNFDGRVDILDIAVAGIAFGSTPTSPRWNTAADINEDNKVNIIDLTLIAINF